MSGLCTLATSCAEPDLEFTSPLTLARHVVAQRERLKSKAAPALYATTLCRDGLTSAQVIAIRLADGPNRGKGALIGYAFIPGTGALGRLRQALADAGAAVVDVAQQVAA